MTEWDWARTNYSGRCWDRKVTRRLRWSKMPTTSTGQRPWPRLAVRRRVGVQPFRGEVNRSSEAQGE